MTRLRAVPVALALLLSACGATGGDPTVGSTPDAGPTYFASLCKVLTLASAGDLPAARRAFDHGPLHELAASVTKVDRRVAARLLEAKQAVEESLADDTSSDRVTENVRSLTDATRDAYRAVDQPVPDPCPTEAK